jgi:UDP-N-acetylmuramyl-tripeptide synthetase
MKKTLKDLLKLIPEIKVIGKVNSIIEDISADSRVIGNNGIFICLKGEHVDGHKYIAKAFEKGAKFALIEDETVNLPEGMTGLLVQDTRIAMELIAPWFFDYPGKTMRMIGVTGTNGKTTTTNILRTVLRAAGYRVGLIGTINIMVEEEVEVSHNTTPDVVDLQKALFKMKEANCDYVVMEVSSHALSLNRVASCEFDTAVLTNITQDHLDFHGTLENYRDAKSLLFEGLSKGTKENKTAVFNMDDASSKIIINRTKVPVIKYGKANTNDIYPLGFEVAAKHMKLKLQTPKGILDLLLHITGEFNVYNVMSAVGALIAENIELDVIRKVLDGFKGVHGRFELVEAGQPYTVIVDYAHTPDGLINVLKTARSITKGKLWVVFGCGGDRDAKKRPIMGSVALDLADEIVVTSDNPRSENPQLIIEDIEKAFIKVPENKNIYTEIDRKKAIEYALRKALADDVVLIAGKGHENYQILNTGTIEFDDCKVVRKYWAGRK